MQRKKIPHSSCLLLGVVGAVLGGLVGLLSALGYGQFGYLRLASFAFTGSMLLFLAPAESGAENKAKRTKLLLLFFALLVSVFNLPLLCPPLEALVLPCLMLLYRPLTSKNMILAAALLEAGFALLRTLEVAELLGSNPGLVLGLGLAAISAARFMFLWQMHQKAKQVYPEEKRS